jgi:acetyl esterase/lipase
MKQGDKRGCLFIVICIFAFLVSFIGSALFKLTYKPWATKYEVDWNDSVGTVHTDLSYGDQAANRFDLYLPADDSRESYGLVVYLHAGGFTSGDKVGDASMLQWLTSMGYVAAGINYTLRDDAHPDASVYSQSLEIRDSIPYVVAEAERLGYQIDEMAISGGSAGGTLAMLYAYRDAGTSPVPVRMLFEAVGPPSFYPEDWTNYGLDQNPDAAAGLFSVMAGTEITVDMLGTEAYEEAIEPISAYKWVNESSVPSVIAYGVHDRVSPFLAVRHLVNALEEHNVPHEYIEFPHSGHGLQNDDALYVQYMDTIIAYLERYLPVA